MQEEIMSQVSTAQVLCQGWRKTVAGEEKWAGSN